MRGCFWGASGGGGRVVECWVATGSAFASYGVTWGLLCFWLREPTLQCAAQETPKTVYTSQIATALASATSAESTFGEYSCET